MTRETYIKITALVRNHPRRIKLLTYTNQGITGAVYLGYPVFLLSLFLTKNPILLRAILVPAISFAIVTVFRRIINAPRPYEKFNLPPALKKDTEGESFPSRHVFSIFVIASTIFYVCAPLGILLYALGVILALGRVIGGVHTPCDVIAGALAGIASGFIGFYLI